MRKQVYAVTIGVLLVLSVFSVLQFWQIKPVYADTFGYTTLGSSQATCYNYEFACCRSQITGGDAILDYIKIGTDASGYHVRVAVYNDNGSSYPGTLLVESGSVETVAGNWVQINFGSTTLINNAYYWLAFQTDVNGAIVDYDGTDATTVYRNASSYGAFSATFPPEMESTTTRKYSIYANYTTKTSDSTAPTYSSPITNTTLNDAICNFTVTFADETDLANYTFGTNNTGSWVNDTVENISGNSYVANTTKSLNDTTGVLIQWEYWFADSSNNLNNTGLQSFITSGNCNLTINSLPVSTTYSINSTATEGYSVNSSSGSGADIQTAVNTVIAAGGGTVYIPEGDWECNQTSAGAISINLASLTNNSWLNIIGSYNNVTALTQAGVNRTMPATILRSKTQHNGGENSTFNIIGAANRHIRISGLAILANVSWAEQGGNYAFYMKGVDGFRIDHCYLDSNCGADILVWMCKGVIDHCQIDQSYHVNSPTHWSWGYGIFVAGDSNTGSGGNASWINLNTALGQYDWTGWTYKAGPVYIENNVFTLNRHAITSAQYSFFVVRYNLFETALSMGMAYVDIHGSGFPSGRGLEAYNNTFYDNPCFNFRGGGGVVFNNTCINNNLFAFLWNEGDGGPSYREWVHDLWLWSNNVSTVGNVWSEPGDQHPVKGTDYFMDNFGGRETASSPAPPRSGYISYTYPHPYTQTSITSGTTNSSLILTYGETYLVTVPSQVASGAYTYNFSHWQDASTNNTFTLTLISNTTITATYTDISVVSVILTAPTNTTYNFPSIFVAFTASGGTIDQKWFNIKNGTTWVYTSNQTYPDFEMMTGFVNGTHYTGYFWANNTDGIEGYATVMFSVQIPMQPLGGTNSIIVNVWWGNFW